jgi:hypothetical protein
MYLIISILYNNFSNKILIIDKVLIEKKFRILNMLSNYIFIIYTTLVIEDNHNF